MNKRAKKKRLKRIIKAGCFALAMTTFSVAIYATRLKEVNIDYLGQSISFKTLASTVEGALNEQNIRLRDSENISTELTSKLSKINEISISKPVIVAMAPVAEDVKESAVAEELKTEDERKAQDEVVPETRTNSQKSAGDTATSRGVARTTWGPDVNEVEDGILETSDGLMIEYSNVIELEATAYCACYECCGKHPWNKWYGITATGTTAKVGTIAVDPNVIPLGTKVYIEGLDGAKNYGFAIAEDTGGAIKGQIIDLYFNTHRETVNWGRQQVKVYVLKDS